MQLIHKSNFYLLVKPKTWTSQDLCTKLKKNFKFKKVGHSGTLDPNADGLMLLATNGYTKLFDYISNTNKTYKVIAMLGYSSPTLDVDSEITKHDDINAHQLQTQIQEFLTNLVGESTQTPPIYSAIKVKGKRLYKYARQNQDVEIPDRVCERGWFGQKVGKGYYLYGKDVKPLTPNPEICLLYTSPSPRDRFLSRMPSSA